MIRLVLSGLLVLTAAAAVPALDQNRGLREFGRQVWLSENGLPQNTAQAIAQTHDGYIWIGTQEGLVRFDGVKFEIFDKQNTPQFSSNDIRSLFVDGSGTLWIATSSGLVRRWEAGEFEAFASNQGWAGNYLGPITEDRYGSVRFVTSRGVVSCDGGKCGLDEMSETIANSVKNLFVRAGTSLVLTSTGLELLKDGALTEWTAAGLKSVNVTAVAEDNNGTLWVGASEGVSEIRDGNTRLYSISEGLPNGRVTCLRVDREGAVWIGTSNGLARLRNGQIETFSTAEGLSSNLVLSIFEDREGSVWVGTEGGGLVLFKNRKFNTLTTKDGLASDLVKAIYQDREGGVWIGTNGGGLTLLKNGQISKFTTRDGLASDVVLSLAGDDAGNLWIGTPDGLNQFKAGKFKTYTFADGLSNDLVRSVYVDRRGDLWVGTRAGLDLFRDHKFTSYTTNDGLANDFIGALLEDSKGSLWIGTLGGLSKFADGKFTSFTTSDGLSSNTITCLHEDADGNLWIGTSGGGLNIFRDGKFASFTSRDGLPDDVIYRILEDSAHRLWFSSNKGVFRLAISELNDLVAKRTSTLNAALYGPADGMLTRECSGGGHPAAWKMNDGKLWFATIKGVATVDPEHLAVNSLPPTLVIEQVRVDDRLVTAPSGSRVAAGSTRFDFYFTAPSFIAPENVHFKYKLEGFDRDWIDGGNRRVAYYTNLRPGNYRFRVMAANNDGVWNEQGAAFDFYLRPHFYQSYWFYALIVLLLGGIVWQLYRLRVRRISSQFSAVLAERNRIAREIHDNLAQDILGISVQLELVARLMPAAEAAKSHLDRARILVRNSMAEARRYVWDLRSQDLENKDLPTALNDTARRLTRDTELQTAVQVTGTFRPLPSAIETNILRIAQEAINNSVKHAGARRIMIDVHFEQDALQLRVQDDGCGFDPQAHNGDGHFGLVGMRERAQEIGGELNIHSQAAAGTEVIVNVPLTHGDRH
jgi:ligand-binding sensor domain-containing protein/signal transduction histidine kinase